MTASCRSLVNATRQSVVLRPDRNPDCILSRQLFFSRYHVSLELIIFSNSLQRQLVREIGRKFRGLVWSLFGFGIGITVATFHELGKVSEIKVSLKRDKIFL